MILKEKDEEKLDQIYQTMIEIGQRDSDDEKSSFWLLTLTSQKDHKL